MTVQAENTISDDERLLRQEQQLREAIRSAKERYRCDWTSMANAPRNSTERIEARDRMKAAKHEEVVLEQALLTLEQERSSFQSARFHR